MAAGYTFLVLCTFLGEILAQNQPIATLYSSSSCTGASQTIPPNNYVPDLSQVGWSNRAYSVKLRGPWMFYDLVNYNMQNAQMEYIYESQERCVNFINLGGRVTSVRYAGHSGDYRQDTITFYDLTYFQADQELTQHDTANLALGGRISSLIVTGSSDWTIYDRANYGGNRFCLRFRPSPTFDPAFYFDTTLMEVPVAHDFIRSIRKGCHAKKVIPIMRSSTNGTVHGANEF